MRTTAYAVGVLGGVCLLVRHFIEEPGGQDILKWGAAVLLGLAGLGIALGLVPTAPLWLQTIVAVGVVILMASVWATIRSAVDTDIADLAVGIGAVVVGLALLGTSRVRGGGPTPPRGARSH